MIIKQLDKNDAERIFKLLDIDKNSKNYNSQVFFLFGLINIFNKNSYSHSIYRWNKHWFLCLNSFYFQLKSYTADVKTS